MQSEAYQAFPCPGPVRFHLYLSSEHLLRSCMVRIQAGHSISPQTQSQSRNIFKSASGGGVPRANLACLPFFFFKDFIYLFMRDTYTEKQRPRQRENQDSIPGPRDHDPSQRQMLNHWATRPPWYFFFLRFYPFIHERHRERGRDTGRGRSRLPIGSPKYLESCPELQADAQPLSHQTPLVLFLNEKHKEKNLTNTEVEKENKIGYLLSSVLNPSWYCVRPLN